MAYFFSGQSHTFNEYLLVPGYSSSECIPDNVSLRTPLTRFRAGEEPALSLNVPMVSAVMQSVSGDRLAVALAQEGGVSFLYGSQSIEDEAAMVARVKSYKAGFVRSDSNISPDATLSDILALREQTGELLGRGDGLGIVLRRAHHDAAGVQVVVERLALAQELGAEEDLLIAQPLAQAHGISDGDRRLDDDPGVRVHRAHGGDGGLDGARVEEVPVAVVVGGRGDDGVVGARICLGHVDGGVQVELALPRLCLRKEALYLVVLDGRLVVVDLCDLLGHDVQRVDLVVLREQNGEGQADVAGTGDSDL